MSVESLLSLPTTQLAATRWLQSAAQMLQGYAPVALVTRRSTQGEEEVRRWSDVPYLRVRGDLFLDGRGRLFRLETQKQRWIHARAFDQSHQLKPLPTFQIQDLEAVVELLIAQHGAMFWRRWAELTAEQRERLAAVPQPWEVLQEALLASPEVLTLLLSEASDEQNRLHLLRAGAAGSYAPPVECLPYLLLQVEWNSSPGVVGLARGCIEADPGGAWQWRAHPNPVVRRRLAQMLPAAQAWLDWLSEESDSHTRDALRLRVEEETEPRVLVETLLRETQAGRRAALGWLLSHWSRPLTQHSFNWKSVAQCLSEPQREALKKRVRRP